MDIHEEEQELRELVAELNESLRERDEIIKRLVDKFEEQQDDIKSLAEGLDSLAQNQVIFADNFKKIGHLRRTSGQPALPSARAPVDFDGWN